MHAFAFKIDVHYTSNPAHPMWCVPVQVCAMIPPIKSLFCSLRISPPPPLPPLHLPILANLQEETILDRPLINDLWLDGTACIRKEYEQSEARVKQKSKNSRNAAWHKQHLLGDALDAQTKAQSMTQKALKGETLSCAHPWAWGERSC